MKEPTEKKLQQEEEAQDLLSEYKAQTEEDDDIHFEHYDWSYNDGSGCCC